MNAYTHSTDWHFQPKAILEQVTLSNSTDAGVMDSECVLIAATATWQVAVSRLQADKQGLSINLGIRFNCESFPEQGKRISIHSGGGESVWIVVLANSKLTGFTAVSYFFTLTRDEPKKSAPRGANIS